MADLTGVGEAVTGVKDILGMFFPDKTEEEKAKMAQAFQILQLQAQADAGQNATNAEGAATGGLHFRDGAGWVCVAGFAIAVLKSPIEWGAALVGHPVVLPAVDTSVIYPMLLGLLGLGGMHMNEQVQARK